MSTAATAPRNLYLYCSTVQVLLEQCTPQLAFVNELLLCTGGEKKQLQPAAWDDVYVNGTVAAAGVALNATAAAGSMHLMLTRLPNCFTVGMCSQSRYWVLIFEYRHKLSGRACGPLLHHKLKSCKYFVIFFR